MCSEEVDGAEEEKGCFFLLGNECSATRAKSRTEAFRS